MTCPHCNNNLPEGLTMCFHCGEALETPAASVHIADKPTTPEPAIRPAGTVCPHCESSLPDGLTACFRCGRSLRESAAPPRPIQGPIVIKQADGKKRGLSGIIAAAVTVFLLGGAASGHFLGFYTLPFLPERTGTVEAIPPETGETPAAATPEASEPVGNGGFDSRPDDVDGPSAAVVSTPDEEIAIGGGTVLPAYSYTDFSYGFHWGPQEYNPDALGMCVVNLTLTGNIENVGAVWTWSWSDSRFSDDDIRSAAAQAIPIWKEGRDSFGDFDGMIGTGHPIFSRDLGKTQYVLLLVLDKNIDALGYIVVETVLPATAGLPEPEVAIEESEGLAVNTDALRLIGKTNAELRAVNGDIGYSEFYNGGPFVSYAGSSVPYPFGFFLDAADLDYDAIFDSDWGANIWPDHSAVNAILLWGDAIPQVFRSGGPVTYDALKAVLTEYTSLFFLAEEEQMDGYGFDVWCCEFFYEQYWMYATFREDGYGLTLVEMYIS